MTIDQKYNDLYNSIVGQMDKLQKKQLKVEEAKAFASLAKQANNVLSIQLDTAKFLNNNKANAQEVLKDVGLTQ
jgi:hypothetical protein